MLFGTARWFEASRVTPRYTGLADQRYQSIQAREVDDSNPGGLPL